MYKVVSLFSGAGGSSCGYKLAGLDVVASVEFIDYQAKNYRHNNPTAKVYECDIRALDPYQVLKDLGIKEGDLDILDGSPPCSSFSTCGAKDRNWGKVKKYSNREQRTDDLFFEYIRFLKALKPKVFVAENVSGLIKGTAKGYFLEILAELKACGYRVKAKVLNAKYYNVPQSRERLIFIGVREDLGIDPSYPIPNNNLISCKKAFENINNTILDIEETSIKQYSIYKEAIMLKEGEASEKYFNLVKQDKNKPSGTITQTGGTLGAASIIHWENRKFTIKELKRICSFPDSYILVGNYKERYEALGRSVPPFMMKAIAENIKENILDLAYNKTKGL